MVAGDVAKRIAALNSQADDSVEASTLGEKTNTDTQETQETQDVVDDEKSLGEAGPAVSVSLAPGIVEGVEALALEKTESNEEAAGITDIPMADVDTAEEAAALAEETPENEPEPVPGPEKSLDKETEEPESSNTIEESTEKELKNEEQTESDNQPTGSNEPLPEESQPETIEETFEHAVSDAPPKDIEGTIETLEENLANDTITPPPEDDDDDDFDDDDFDDFNEFQGAPEPEYVAPPTTLAPGLFPLLLFQNADEFRAKVDEVLGPVFDDVADHAEPTDDAPSLLDERSSQVYQEVSRIPRLQPPNWIRLNIRHNLLIKLGIPIDLDETSTAAAPEHTEGAPSLVERGRRPSVVSANIDWHGLPIPPLEALNLGPLIIKQRIEQTHATLDRIETDNMTNLTPLFLASAPEDVVDAKLAQFKRNFEELLTLASVWQNQMEEQLKNYDIYLEVVQSMVGYSHKKARHELEEKKRSERK